MTVLPLRGDLNRHAGEDIDGNRCHGGKSFRTRNMGGERLVVFAELAFVNR